MKTIIKILKVIYEAVLRLLIISCLLASVWMLYRTCVCKGVTMWDVKEEAAVIK